MSKYQLPGVSAIEIYGRSKEKIQNFNGRPIWSSYLVDINFQGADREWTIGMFIRVSDLGTPTLSTLEIRSGMKSLQKNNNSPFIIQHLKEKEVNGADLSEIIGDLEHMGSAFYEFDLPSVERWQIKFAEQNRHILMQMAIIEGLRDCSIELGKEVENIDSRVIDSKIRKKITPEFLKQVAFYYENAVINGEDPIKNLEILYQAAERTVQSWATQARKNGFLPPTTQGKISVSNKNPSRKEGK
jgi:hypothetical protein